MPQYTSNMNLYKVDLETDGNSTFNIKTMLNDNWDKVDSKYDEHDSRIRGNGDEVNKVKENVGDKSQLITEDKSSLVQAVNEVSAGMADIAYKTVGGTANAIAVTKQGFTLTDGQYVEFKATTNNTGIMTIKVNGLTIKGLRNEDGEQLSNGDIEANKYYKAIYNSNNDFFLLAPKGADIQSIYGAYDGANEIELGKVKQGQYVYSNKDVWLDDGKPIGNIKINSDYSAYPLVDDNYIYYRNLITKHLEKVSIDTGDKVTLSNKEPIFSMASYGDKIVFWSSTSPTGIYSINKDGSGETLLTSDNTNSIAMTSNKIIYRNNDDGNKLYSMNYDGTNKEVLSSRSVMYVKIYNDNTVYFSSNTQLYKCLISDKIVSRIQTSAISDFNIFGEDILYLSNNELFKYNIINSTETTILEDSFYNATVPVLINNYVYYVSSNQSNNKLCRVYINGGNAEKLTNYRVDNISTNSKIVVYHNATSQGTYKYIPKIIMSSLNTGVDGQADTQFQAPSTGVLKSYGTDPQQITGFISKKPIGWGKVDVIPKVKMVKGIFVVPPNKTSFKNAYGNNVSCYYITIDLSTIGFVPNKIIITRTNKSEDGCTFWFYGNIHESYNYYYNCVRGAITSDSLLRVPYINGVMKIPVPLYGSFDYIIYGGEE